MIWLVLSLYTIALIAFAHLGVLIWNDKGAPKQDHNLPKWLDKKDPDQ